ncbi:uncharacterized protein LOC119743409 [Patiria miniata]|uniref:Tripartite motif-containing protein 2-like n=1 Tax=Patiria miniata TaxID=46514 RepID=A0A914BIR2_PATMI|nr:uncharacterized protein LOC119743409 [Patiria miniata]
MASFPIEPLSRELECGICLEILRDPRILDCSHTFCGPCIPGVVESSRKSIKCPLCQQHTVMPSGGVGALKPNLLARSMAEAMTTMNLGSIEVGQEATEPQPLPQSRPTAGPSPSLPTCLAHPGQRLEFYCVECKLPLCRQCTVDTHLPPQHTVSDIDNVAGGPRAQLKDLVDLFETEQAKYDQTLQIVKDREVDFTAAAQRARKDISEATEMIIADVRTKQQQLLDQVDFITGTRRGVIGRYVVEIQGVLDGSKDVIPIEKNNFEGKDDSTIMALHRRIKNGLEKMKHQPPPSPEVIDGLGFLKFSAERTPAFNLHLGDLLEDEEWSLDLKFGSFGSDIGKFNCARGVAISPAGDIAIAEQRNNRTCIFDTNGKHKVTMSGKSSGNPKRGDRDVAFFPDGRCMILSKTSNIDMYGGNGSHLNCILTPSASPWSFAVDAGGTIYLGDALQKTIYIIVDGQVIRKLKPTQQPIHLDVDNKGRMLVSNHVSKRVDIMSTTTGDVLFSIPSKSIDPSNQVSPWGACFGPSGSIFVPFYINDPKLQLSQPGSVHEFGADGRHVGCVARDLSIPRSVRFTLDGRLIVCEGTRIKLFRKV